MREGYPITAALHNNHLSQYNVLIHGLHSIEYMDDCWLYAVINISHKQ